MRIGLLLPHFGRHANTSRLTDGVAQIEALGYDSVWVRDHVVYRPHPFEDADATFLEALTVLAAAAARSTRLILGTATLIPFRHPIHSAMQLATLASLGGSNRLLIAWGSGNDPREFEAVGSPGTRRGARLEEHVALVRRLLAGETVTHHGEHYDFEDVRIEPPDGPLAFWYGGGTPRAMERTVRLFDGLLASRIPRSMLRERIDYLAELSAAAGRRSPEVGVVTLVSPAPTVEEGLRSFDQERVVAEIERRFPGRGWQRGTGLDGVMVAGRPDQLIDEFSRFAELGVTHLVIDLRSRFDEWPALTAALATDVLPHLRRTLP